MINIYIPKNSLIYSFEFLIFSIISILLIDKIFFYVFRLKYKLTKTFGSHEEYNIEFPFIFIIYLLFIGIIPGMTEYIIKNLINFLN